MKNMDLPAEEAVIRMEMSEKPESVKKNPALGKPVMRENPNRNVSQQDAASAPEMPAEKPEQASGSNWAEAVRKAIDSIN